MRRRYTPLATRWIRGEQVGYSSELGGYNASSLSDSSMPMIIEQYVGRKALQWLAEEDNIAAWTRLYDTCSWATPYQSPLFARVWLKHYGDLWEPLLLVSTGIDKQLSGILPLARRGKTITGIGAQQAEYQAWLCIEADAEVFLASALRTLFQAFPDACLRLRYIEPGIASNAVKSLNKSQSNLMIQSHLRPLMALDSAAIDAVLRKKGNRSKLNRLKRRGELELVCDKLEMDRETSLDEIIEYYDFRQGAVNDSRPFLEDPCKRAFHLDWLAIEPDQLEVCRLCLDGRTIAALVGVIGPSRTSNAILAYSPHYARQSPGKLHLYLVAQTLSGKGQSWLDLTPGGDPWKERFATHHDEVLELNAWANPAIVQRLKRRQMVNQAARRLLQSLGISPTKLKSWFSALRGFRFRTILDILRRLPPQRIECRIYRMNLETWVEKGGDKDALIRINALADITRFDPSDSAQSRHHFLESALNRIERGEKVYSVCVDDILLHFGWLSLRQEKHYIEELRQSYTYPEPGALLSDFHTQPQARGLGYCQYSITRMLDDLAMLAGAKIAYISVLSDNAALRHVVEKVGFEYMESLVREHSFIGSRYRKLRLE